MELPPAVTERLGRLADDQRAAATAAPGPVLCVAPAGSGKTTTVVARICWRIATGADPAAITALTFNRRAADELRERLDAALDPMGVEAGSVRVRTFHALGLEILGSAGVDVSRIVDRASVLERLAGAPLPVPVLRRLDDAFSRLRLDPERGPPAEEVAIHAAWAAYRAALLEAGELDMDDLVARALEQLRSDGAVLAAWRARCRSLFVDEAQDLDRTQLELSLALTGEGRDIFLVGDDDQTIYAWRLADVRRILCLAASLPGLRRVDLVTNHRCPPEVVRRAARLVEHGQERFVKRIEPSPRTRGRLLLAADPGDEVARARRLMGAWFGRAEGGHAVLARTNAELTPYAAVARELGVSVDGGTDELLLGPELDGAIDLVRTSTSDRAPLLIRIEDCRRAAVGHDASMERLLASLLAWAAGHGDLDALVAALARVRGPLPTEPVLALATVHGTKGLEFDHVAVVGMDEGVFPSRRSIEDSAEPERTLEEERRLAYVAWTRARLSLTLVYDPDAPSRFMLEAFDPAELRPP